MATRPIQSSVQQTSGSVAFNTSAAITVAAAATSLTNNSHGTSLTHQDSPAPAAVIETQAVTFWGKARPSIQGGVAMHPIIAHCLDVAAVAILLPGPPSGLDRRALGWLVSMHDIGKFSRPFQAQAAHNWPTQALGPLDATTRPPPGPRHDAIALSLLLDTAADLLDETLPPSRDGRHNWDDGSRSRLFRGIAGHHGRPVAKPDITSRVLDAACIQAARAFVQAMTAVFRPPAILLPRGPAFARLEWELAGITNLADWVGSHQAWFPYAPMEAVADPAAYFWSRALPQAAAALQAAGLGASRPAPFIGLKHLFPTIARSTPVQAWAETVPLPPGPALAVIEDLTGSGKTEAAVTLAHRLMANGQASGVFFALPTMATANAMFDRMATAYRALFASEAAPSLALVHGRAALDPRFTQAFAPAPGDAGQTIGRDVEPSEASCTAWLADDRRRALLAQVGVGTIDQALLAVLPVRFAALRLQGLRGKVLVIDEAHAFDAYMERELVELLHYHAALGGSAILLSATLPKATRQKLVDAYRKGLGASAAQLASQDYPLATLIGAGTLLEQACAPRPGLSRQVMVTRLPDAEAAIERILAAATAGAAVVWIRNTVDDALAAAAALRQRGAAPLVFHARFALCDRIVVEAEVLQRFGPNGDPASRSGILVASQVAQSSLDLDFDLVCSDLAPIDSLIQRAGRLWRHVDRTARPLDQPELLVISPEPVDNPPPGWINHLLPGTAAVYKDPALLWRSARVLFAKQSLTTPGDMRPMIEFAADAQAPNAIPPALAASANRAAGKNAAASGIGAQNTLKFRQGYAMQSGAWDLETRTPTRLEETEQVTLRLARLHKGRLLPYAVERNMARAWSLSEVSVAKHRITACPIPPGLETAAAAARAQWGRWERESDRFILAVLQETEQAGWFTLQAQAGSNSTPACYSPQEGLIITTSGPAA